MSLGSNHANQITFLNGAFQGLNVPYSAVSIIGSLHCIALFNIVTKIISSNQIHRIRPFQ